MKTVTTILFFLMVSIVVSLPAVQTRTKRQLYSTYGAAYPLSYGYSPYTFASYPYGGLGGIYNGGMYGGYGGYGLGGYGLGYGTGYSPYGIYGK
ncbi:hypothetical protein Q1695_007514 [Nippostrongylus brasiliensis]|nr:hypothetical protein Q1695_007514 [Nippostrongylus brasiliensis]